MTNLTYTHITFNCIATTPVHFDHHWAGNRLRGALGYILLNTTCPIQQRQPIPTPAHADVCPACWLLSHKLDPGHARRAYSIVPPMPTRATVHPDEPFAFTITLLGDGQQFLPYFALAVSEMGRSGVGGRHRNERGTFTVNSITAHNGLTEQTETLLAPGSDLVQVPTRPVRWENALNCQLPIANSTLTIHFLSPTRLIHNKQLMKQPNFGVLFRRLLHRIDTLGTQFAGIPRRSAESCDVLHALADSVKLRTHDVSWVDLRPRSGRDRQYKPMGGFVGSATYEVDDWTPLLPYLVFGQGLQVGKSATKGNGVYELAFGDKSYWSSNA